MKLLCKEFASCTHGSFFYGNTYDVSDKVASDLLSEFPGRFETIGGVPVREKTVEKPVAEKTVRPKSTARKGKKK